MVTCSLLVAAANAFVPCKPLALCSRAKSTLRVVPPVISRGRRREKKGAQEQPPMQGKKKVRSARTDPTLSHAHRPIWRLRPCARGPTLPHAHRIPGAPRLLHPLACARGPTLRMHIAFLATLRMHIALPGACASPCAPGPTWFSLSGLPPACSPIRRSFPRAWAKTLFALGLSRPPCVKKTSMHCERASTTGTRWSRAT